MYDGLVDGGISLLESHLVCLFSSLDDEWSAMGWKFGARGQGGFA